MFTSSILFINDTFYPAFFVVFFLYLVIYFLPHLCIRSFTSPCFYCLVSPSALCMLRTPFSLAVRHMQFCFLVSLLTQTVRLIVSRSLYPQCEIPTRISIVRQWVKQVLLQFSYSIHYQSVRTVPYCYQQRCNPPNNMQDGTHTFRSRYTIEYRYVCRAAGILWFLVSIFSAVPVKAPSARSHIWARRIASSFTCAFVTSLLQRAQSFLKS